MLLVMNEQGVQKLLQNKVTLGADASIAAGPLGRQGSVATDAALTAEILAYSRAKGLFAGINLSGGVLRPDEDANTSVYGKGASPRTVLASTAISAPPEATAFLRALESQAISTASAADRPMPSQPAPTSPRTTTMPTTDDDLRARVVDLQQMLDRILADTTPAPSAPAARLEHRRGTVTVDRARLLQLRQQLDAMMARSIGLGEFRGARVLGATVLGAAVPGCQGASASGGLARRTSHLSTWHLAPSHLAP